MRLEKNGLIRVVADPVDAARLIQAGYTPLDDADDADPPEDGEEKPEGDENGEGRGKGKGTRKAAGAAT